MTFGQWMNLHQLDGRSEVRSIITQWNNIISNCYEGFSLSDKEILIFSNEIMFKLKSLYNFELLYDVVEIGDTADTICVVEFNNIIKYSAFKLSGELRNLIAYKDDDLKNAQYESEGEAGIGYSGFDIENQDGDFQKNRQFTKENDKIKYYGFLNKKAKYFASYIYEEIKRLLLVGVY